MIWEQERDKKMFHSSQAHCSYKDMIILEISVVQISYKDILIQKLETLVCLCVCNP